MQITVTGHRMEVTAALRSYAEDKLRRLERHFDHVTNMHVVLSVEKQRQRAEGELHVNRANLFADAEHEDMYAAIDLLADKLDTQIRKHKDKLTDHHRAGRRRGGKRNAA